MGVGTFLEPVTVVILLFGGAWVNRTTDSTTHQRHAKGRSASDAELGPIHVHHGSHELYFKSLKTFQTEVAVPTSLSEQEHAWRKRKISIFGYTRQLKTPNTAVFRQRLLSKLLWKFPFLVEVWYWAMIYWIYQLGRAFTALTLVEDTVIVARKHALQVIEVEKLLHIFWELPVQHFFIAYPRLMHCINWVYSFIHIPATVLFLVCLYYHTITCGQLHHSGSTRDQGAPHRSINGARLYEARRRAMAVCNLLAFTVFTIWPCMPPRLLSDPQAPSPLGDVARSYGFVDTVHSKTGSSSVWTQNRFCNQYAAMPSLHFGYALLVGMTIVTVPLGNADDRSWRPSRSLAFRTSLPSLKRAVCVTVGVLYPLMILVAIISTANHFVLDAVAGALVCVIGWRCNTVLLNLLPLEDYFLWCLRIHKPVQ